MKLYEDINFVEDNFGGTLPLEIVIQTNTQLKNSIIDKMDKDYTTIELKLPYEKPREIAFSQRDVDIIERDYRNDHIYLKIRGPAERIDQIELMLKK